VALEIRRAGEADWPGIWPIWRDTVAAGDAYVWLPGTPEVEARAAWMLPPPAEVWVAEDSGRIVATALLQPNKPGLGDHVANAGFMVDPSAAGRGVGRRLAEAVLEQARAAGYVAMQFNAVVATNAPGVRLWRSMGFDEVGRVPQGFRHARHGPVDLLLMHRRL
jgi:L-amino acid N-acyltransferase YncA